MFPPKAQDSHSDFRIVALVGEAPEWQSELGWVLGRDGYLIERVPRLDGVVNLLGGSRLEALFLAAGPLTASDLLHLCQIRELSPRTAVVMVTNQPTDPDLKRAFESGATAFLSWPAAPEAIRQAIQRRTRHDADGSRSASRS
jgi:DNA-binding NtrC family response regulator